MIDEKNRIIYIDNSTRSLFQACKEKDRLGGLLGYRSNTHKASLDFGHAFHAAIAAYYDSIAGGFHDQDGRWHKFNEVDYREDAVNHIQRAQAGFLHDLGFTGAQLPVSLESEERRSIERGLALIDAYIYRWRNEPYGNLLDAQGAPLTEVGFKYYVTTIDGYEIWYVGFIDRLMQNLATLRPVIFETKTTTKALSQFILQCKPNHQITGYFPAALGIDANIRECIWDCVFISSRKPDMQKALKDRFWMYGINVEDDFKRQPTGRSNEDIVEFKADIEEVAIEYAKYVLRGTQSRWPRTTESCHLYDGCQFRNVCSINGDEARQSILDTFFHIEKWEPWKKILKLED